MVFEKDILCHGVAKCELKIGVANNPGEVCEPMVSKAKLGDVMNNPQYQLRQLAD
jgi:hypothetical protein